MFKKYIPFVILLAAAFAILYIKTHQRGVAPDTERIHITPSTTAANIAPANDTKPEDEDVVNRNPAHLLYSKHARCRMECRHITETEIKEILSKGNINYDKIEPSPEGRIYPFEGITQEHQHLRIVFAPKGDNVVEVVTCIDLDTEWSCNCD
ncbi:MAG TPA: DUF4258 domain-containing protein [Ferruginibacter sp.]|jgi:hypothetical protein|nr:DUF4258 domain-containing protein [Ferruginibacter sp.]